MARFKEALSVFTRKNPNTLPSDHPTDLADWTIKGLMRFPRPVHPLQISVRRLLKGLRKRCLPQPE